jgi:hypothetical protein
MKPSFVLAALALVFSAQAFAAPMYIECNFNHYQHLTKVLDSYTVVKGAELKEEVKDVLTQEMGPTCHSVVDPNLMGIPGNRYYTYELNTGAAKYTISVEEGGAENPGKKDVSFAKKSN